MLLGALKLAGDLDGVAVLLELGQALRVAGVGALRVPHVVRHEQLHEVLAGDLEAIREEGLSNLVFFLSFV